jgi:hypothetical protein
MKERKYRFGSFTSNLVNGMNQMSNRGSAAGLFFVFPLLFLTVGLDIMFGVIFLVLRKVVANKQAKMEAEKAQAKESGQAVSKEQQAEKKW